MTGWTSFITKKINISEKDGLTVDDRIFDKLIYECKADMRIEHKG